MPKAIPKDEFTANINNLVHQLCSDLLKMKKELDEIKEELRIQTLQSDAQRSCMIKQSDSIETIKREENIWRERMRKALSYANFQTEMQTIKKRDEEQPF